MPDSAVRIVFECGGIAEVEKAFKGVDAAMAKLERTRKSSGRRAVQDAKRDAGEMADAHIKATKEYEANRVKSAMNALRQGQQLRKREVADAKQAAADKLKAEDEYHRNSTAHFRHMVDMKEKAEKQAAKTSVRTNEQAEREKSQSAERQGRWRDGLFNRSQRAAQTLRDREVRAERSAGEQMDRDRKRIADRSSRWREGVFNRSTRAAQTLRDRDTRQAQERMDHISGRMGAVASGTLGRMAGSAINMGALGLTLGGGLSVMDSVSRATSAERLAIDVAHAAYIPGENERPDPKAISARAAAAQAVTGLDKRDLLRGLRSYTASSADFGGGMKNLEFFGQLAQGAGSSVEDVMNAAGIIKGQNKSMDADAMRETMLNIIAQGKLGAVELPALATSAGKITATSAAYAGNQTDVQRSLLGLAQIAIKTSGSPEEAATAVSRLASDAMKARGMMPTGVFNKSGVLNDPAQLIKAVMGATGGNLMKIQDMGFNERSFRIFEALAPIMADAERAKKGTGLGAVEKEIDRFTKAHYSEGEFNKDVADAIHSHAVQFDIAVVKIKDAMEVKIIPWIDKFTEKLPDIVRNAEKAINAVGSFAEFMSDNPIKGMGLIVGGAIAKDVGAVLASQAVVASIGASFRYAISAAIIPGAAAASGAGGAAVGGGVAGAVGVSLGAATIGGGIGMALGYGATRVEEAFHSAHLRRASDDLLFATNAPHGSPQTPGETIALQANIAKIQKAIAEAEGERERAGPSALVAAGSVFMGTDSDLIQAQRAEQAAYTVIIKQLREQLELLSDALGAKSKWGGFSGARNHTFSTVNRTGDGGADEVFNP